MSPHAQAAKFIEWLRTADDDGSEEEEDDNEEDDI